jgi:membrane protease YdiL (CAAX protease family)
MSRLHDRIAAFGEVLLCSSVPTQIAIAILLSNLGLNPRTEGGQLSLHFVVAMTLLDTVLLIGLMVFFTVRRGERVSRLWLGYRPIGREAALGFALIPIIFMLVVLLLNLLRGFAPGLHNVEVNPLEQLATGGPGNAVVFGLVVIVAGGVREELVRAFLLRRFEEYLGGAWVGALVLSAAFGFGHYDQGWDAVIVTGLLGAFWAVVYLRRRSAVAPIVSHAGFNSLEVVRIVVMGS